MTLLICAASQCRVEVVKALVAKGADPRATNKKGETALMAAAAKGCKELVDYLLSKGVPIEATTTNGVTALLEVVAIGNAGNGQILD